MQPTAEEREMVDGLISMHLDEYKASGAELIMGNCRFIAPKTIEVRLNKGGTRVITGEPAILPGSPGRINLALRDVRKPETGRISARCISTGCRSNHGRGGSATIAAVRVLPSRAPCRGRRS